MALAERSGPLRPKAKAGSSYPRVGLIGVGHLGSKVARRLKEAGYPVTVCDREWPRAFACVQDGCEAAKMPTEVAEASKIILLALPGEQAVAEVLLGKRGIAVSKPGKWFIVDLTTTSPTFSRTMAQSCAEAGSIYVDAPVIGGERAAESGALTVLIGGEEAQAQAAKRMLRSFATTVIHVGPQGHGALARQIHELLFRVRYRGFEEAMRLADRIGLDRSRLTQGIVRGMLSDPVTDTTRPPEASPQLREFLESADIDVPFLRMAFDGDPADTSSEFPE